MPVSDTSKETTVPAWLSTGWSVVHPPAADDTLKRTAPCEVNLNAFDNRFFSTCCRRLESVRILRPRRESTCTSNERPLRSAS